MQRQKVGVENYQTYVLKATEEKWNCAPDTLSLRGSCSFDYRTWRKDEDRQI